MSQHQKPSIEQKTEEVRKTSTPQKEESERGESLLASVELGETILAAAEAIDALVQEEWYEAVHHLSWIIKKFLVKFRDSHCGLPVAKIVDPLTFATLSGGEQRGCITKVDQEWNESLAKMIHTFTQIENGEEGDPEGLKLFAKYFEDLWD